MRRDEQQVRLHDVGVGQHDGPLLRLPAEAAGVSRGKLLVRGFERRHDPEPGHGDETAVGRPQLGRSSFKRHQRDLQIEDSGTVDGQVDRQLGQ